MCGDCLELMNDISDKSIDMILCDLPYGTTNCKWDIALPFIPLWNQYNRIIKDNGAICLFGQEPFSSNLRINNIKNYRYDWIWEKTVAVGFLNAKKMPLRAHENISVFYKKLPVYNPIFTYSTPYIKKDMTFGKSDIYRTGKKFGDICESKDGRRYPRSVLKFKKDCQRLHPTQKPIALCEYFIKTYTNEGDIILDNCMGSGSTGVACVNTKRDFIGIEKDENYFNIARERIEEAKRSYTSTPLK